MSSEMFLLGEIFLLKGDDLETVGTGRAVEPAEREHSGDE
jgi:hypothetical protein